jgi:hypothetical protein
LEVFQIVIIYLYFLYFFYFCCLVNKIGAVEGKERELPPDEKEVSSPRKIQSPRDAKQSPRAKNTTADSYEYEQRFELRGFAKKEEEKEKAPPSPRRKGTITLLDKFESAVNR